MEGLGARSEVITGCSKKTKDLQSENRQHATCITCRASNFFIFRFNAVSLCPLSLQGASERGVGPSDRLFLVVLAPPLIPELSAAAAAAIIMACLSS